MYGYPHPVCAELENSGIRVAVGDCSITEHLWWRPPYQTGKTVMCKQKYYKHNEDRQNCNVQAKILQTQRGRTHGTGFAWPLSHSGNVVTRTGLQQQLNDSTQSYINNQSLNIRGNVTNLQRYIFQEELYHNPQIPNLSTRYSVMCKVYFWISWYK